MCLVIFFPFCVSFHEALGIKTLLTGPQFSRMFNFTVGSSQDEGLTLAAEIYSLLILNILNILFLTSSEIFPKLFLLCRTGMDLDLALQHGIF